MCSIQHSHTHIHTKVYNPKVPRGAKGKIEGLLLVLLVNSTRSGISLEKCVGEELSDQVGHWVCLQEAVLIEPNHVSITIS